MEREEERKRLAAEAGTQLSPRQIESRMKVQDYKDQQRELRRQRRQLEKGY